MRSQIIFKSIIFCLFIQNVLTDVERVSGNQEDNLNRDLCYLWSTHRYPFWAHPMYKRLLKEKADKFFHKQGKLVPAAEINEKCKIFPKNILDPEHNAVHFEICYYAKHGFWFSKSHNEHETKKRQELLNEYVILGGKRINQSDAKLICYNYEKMMCPLCQKEKEQMCFYAANGFWKKDKKPENNNQSRFFYNGESLIDWKEIWNKCTHYFKRKAFSNESVHYPLCSYTTTQSTMIQTSASSATKPPPSQNTPYLEYFMYFTPPPPSKPCTSLTPSTGTHLSVTSPLPDTPSPNTPPQDSLNYFMLPPPSPPTPETLPPENPPPETSPPNNTPYGDYFSDEPPEHLDFLPLWYFPDESILSPPQIIDTTVPTRPTIETTPSTTPKTSKTNTSPTSTTSKTVTSTTTSRIITTPTITAIKDVTVEGPVCPTCSHNKDACQCNEKHLHLHLHIDGNNSILTKEVLKTLKLFNYEKD